VSSRSPPEGKLVGQIKLPTRNITCVEFVGTDLFITTARDDDDEGEGDSKLHGGGLFRVDVGTTGLPPNNYKFAR
jgi:sugar lactone lactonase YvrE